ncbi:MAG TPA: hypothetical protein VIP05_25365 [Burkholderiaceae bacterium]
MPEALASCAAGLLRALCLPATDLAADTADRPMSFNPFAPPQSASVDAGAGREAEAA